MQLLQLDSRENAGLVPNLRVINNKWKGSDKLTDEETRYLLDILKEYPKFSPKLSPVELPNLLKDQPNSQAFRGELKYLHVGDLRSFLISSVSKNDLTTFHDKISILNKPEEIILRAQEIVKLLNGNMQCLSNSFTLRRKKDYCAVNISGNVEPAKREEKASPENPKKTEQVSNNTRSKGKQKDDEEKEAVRNTVLKLCIKYVALLSDSESRSQLFKILPKAVMEAAEPAVSEAWGTDAEKLSTEYCSNAREMLTPPLKELDKMKYAIENELDEKRCLEIQDFENFLIMWNEKVKKRDFKLDPGLVKVFHFVLKHIQDDYKRSNEIYLKKENKLMEEIRAKSIEFFNARVKDVLMKNEATLDKKTFNSIKESTLKVFKLSLNVKGHLHMYEMGLTNLENAIQMQ